MKTITRLAIAIAAVAASLMAVSCTRFEYKEDLYGGGKVFHASFEAVGVSDTKTYLDSDHKLLWTADDRLSIFEGNTYNQQYRYKGQTGESSADFEKVQTSGFHSGNDISSNYAVYPYLQENKIGNDGKMTIALPSVQQYTAGSFGLGANTMVAVTNGTSDTFLAFKNLCGYLVIKLYGEGTVKSISFKGNNGEKIAGSATVTASYGSEPYVVMTNTATKEITLDCGSGVALGSTSQTATEFWFCIPPVTFSKGFSIKVTNTYGWAMEKSISSSRTISRNTINPMSALEVEFTEPPIPVPEMVDLGLSVKWASFNIGASKPEEYGDYYAWGETDPYYEVGYAQEDPQAHWKTGYGTVGYKFPNYKWCNGSSESLTKYCSDSEYGTVDNKTVLELEDDAAHVKLGDKWRIPTNDELIELKENCTWTWTQLDGVNGYKVTSNKSGYTDKWIFLPAAGRRIGLSIVYGTNGLYWSSSLTNDDPSAAFYFNSDYVSMDATSIRCLGFSIRPVYGDVVRVENISISEENLCVVAGVSSSLKATVYPSNAAEKNVIWSSSDESVVKVDASGKLYTLAKGSAIITVRTVDGNFKSSCTVTVISQPEPEIVDLGLSVKWASFNVGAARPEDYGGYYQWAGIQPDTNGGMNNNPNLVPYHIGDNIYVGWTKYVLFGYSAYWGGSGAPDNKTVLDPEDDVACVELGGKWRMPTDDEWRELQDECTWTDVSVNGINGYSITSKKPGYTDKWIFLPKAGYGSEDYNNIVNYYGVGDNICYWSSSLCKDYMRLGNSMFDYIDDGHERDYWQPVRPVYGDRVNVSGISIENTSMDLPYEGGFYLNVFVEPWNATEDGIIWTSSNSNIVNVDGNGYVTGINRGTAVVTAKSVDGGFSANCSITVTSISTPDPVDLGLSVKWASFNLGASKPEEPGGCYQWAGTQNVHSKCIYLQDNPYVIGDINGSNWTKYVTLDDSYFWAGGGVPDNKTILDPEDDVVQVKLGGNWRMPTYDECTELVENCIWAWTDDYNGNSGYMVTSKKPGYENKSIFLPTSWYRFGDWYGSYGGNYWSSSLSTFDSRHAYAISFDSSYISVYEVGRWGGMRIRPVSE